MEVWAQIVFGVFGLTGMAYGFLHRMETNLRKDLGGQIAEVRKDLGGQIVAVRNELGGQIADVRKEIADVRKDLGELGNAVARLEANQLSASRNAEPAP